MGVGCLAAAFAVNGGGEDVHAAVGKVSVGSVAAFAAAVVASAGFHYFYVESVAVDLAVVPAATHAASSHEMQFGAAAVIGAEALVGDVGH